MYKIARSCRGAHSSKITCIIPLFSRSVVNVVLLSLCRLHNFISYTHLTDYTDSHVYLLYFFPGTSVMIYPHSHQRQS